MLALPPLRLESSCLATVMVSRLAWAGVSEANFLGLAGRCEATLCDTNRVAKASWGQGAANLRFARIVEHCGEERRGGHGESCGQRARGSTFLAETMASSSRHKRRGAGG